MPRISQSIGNFAEASVEQIEKKLTQKFPDLMPATEIREMLDEAGASVHDVTNRLVQVFHSEESGKTVHDIGKTFLQMHGVLADVEKQGTHINLVINSDDAKVMAILNPDR